MRRRGGPEFDGSEGLRGFIGHNTEPEAFGLHRTFVAEAPFTGYGQLSATLTFLTWLRALRFIGGGHHVADQQALDARGTIQGQSVGHASAAIMARDGKFLAAEGGHHFHQILSHGVFGVCHMARVRLRSRTVPVADQVWGPYGWHAAFCGDDPPVAVVRPSPSAPPPLPS